MVPEMHEDIRLLKKRRKRNTENQKADSKELRLEILVLSLG